MIIFARPIHDLRIFMQCMAYVIFLFSDVVYAFDLLHVYNLAKANDPQYKQVIATHQATLEQRPQAISRLLPTLELQANTSQNSQDISTQSFGVAGDVDFNSHGYSLNLSQPIFRGDRFIRMFQANSVIDQADAELIAAQHQLIIRVAESYFTVLAAHNNLDFARAEKISLSRQLDQAKQRFEVGLTAITDVQEAQAGYDRAFAGEIEAANNVDNTREALREIIGDYLTKFAILKESIPLLRPEPDDILDWTEIALEQNPEIVAAVHAVEGARDEIKLQYAGHLPSLDLVARQDFNKSSGRFGDTKIHSSVVGLELSVPIFQGGFVNSRTREAVQLLEQRLQRLEQVRRRTQRATREAYLGVISGISRVKALKQAVISSETALEATEAGFQVGTRTAVDVVVSERILFQSRRDFAQAKYDYLLDTLRLKRAAGILSSDDIVKINQWLN